MTSSGSPTCSSAIRWPLAAYWPPRQARRLHRGPTAENGWEEFRELRPSRRFNSRTSAHNSSIIRACSTSARRSLRDDCSDLDTSHDQHVPYARSRTDAPQDHRAVAEWLLSVIIRLPLPS
jgi:hypothetical protein